MKIFYGSFVFSCHLFLMSSTSISSIPFLLFFVPIFAWDFPLVSLIFLKRSPFYCFPLFLCIDHWGRLSYLYLLFFGTLHSNGCIFPFLLCLSLLFFSQLFVRPPQTTILPFCTSFSWGWSSSLPPVQCQEPQSIVLQAPSQSDLIPWICFSLPLYNLWVITHYYHTFIFAQIVPHSAIGNLFELVPVPVMYPIAIWAFLYCLTQDVPGLSCTSPFQLWDQPFF